MSIVDWQAAIKMRHSVRKYRTEPIKDSDMERVKNFIDTFEMPFENDVEIRFYKAVQNKKLYSIFNAPTDGMAFMANTDEVSISKVGFVGELVILYAASLGIDTCWYGHYKIAELERIMPHLPSPKCLKSANMGYGYSKKGAVEGKRAICITPLGYRNEEGINVLQKIQSFVGIKRKSVDALLETPIDFLGLPKPLQDAIMAASKAPSAMNSQHWRFKTEDDNKTVTIAMPNGYKHLKWEHPNVDIGICASHFWITLKENGYNPMVTLSESGGRVIWEFRL